MYREVKALGWLVRVSVVALLAVAAGLAPLVAPVVEAQAIETPTITSIVPGDRQLTVHWTVTGPAPLINGYKVQWKSGGQNYSALARQITAGENDRSRTITGLSNGTQYTVRVIAFTWDNEAISAEQTAVAGVPAAASQDRIELTSITFNTYLEEGVSWRGFTLYFDNPVTDLDEVTVKYRVEPLDGASAADFDFDVAFGEQVVQTAPGRLIIGKYRESYGADFPLIDDTVADAGERVRVTLDEVGHTWLGDSTGNQNQGEYFTYDLDDVRYSSLPHRSGRTWTVPIEDNDSLPKAPSNLTGEVWGTDRVHLTWQAGADGGLVNGEEQPLRYQFRVDHIGKAKADLKNFRASPEGWVDIEGDDITSFTVQDPAINLGVNTYEFWVRAASDAGASEQTGPARLEMQDFVPAPPKNLRVSAMGTDRVRLDWEPSPHGGYINGQEQPLKYQYRIENIPTGWREIPGEGVTSHTVGDLSLHNTHYTFQIRAVNQVGPSWTSGDIVSPGFVNVPPEPPSNLRVTALGPQTARLEWDASPDPGWANGQPAGNLRYQYRLLNINGPWVHATIGAETTRDSRGLLLYAARYEWQVRAISAGGVSAASNTAGVGPVPTVPEPPSNLRLTIVDRNRVQLTWDASPHGGWINGQSQVPRYQYRIHEPDDAFVEVPGGNVTSYVVAGLDLENNSYRFQLRAVNDHGHSWTTGDIIELGPVDLTAVASIAVTSNPGQDSFYAIGDIVRATVLFDENVTVTGSPTLTLDLDGVSKTAPYTAGPESDARIVHFSYTVAEGDMDADGIAIPANALNLNGGAITNAAGNDALLTHDAVNAGPAHRVDGVRPTFSSAAVSADGTTVTLSFSEAVTAPPLLLEISQLINVPVDRFYMAVLDVSAAGRPAPLAGAEISNGQIILSVRNPIGQSQAVTVTYDNIFAENSVGLFIDAAGNPLLNFAPQAAVNNSTVNVPTPATDPNDAVVLSRTEITVPEGQSRSYTVRLASRPSADVFLNIASSFGQSRLVNGRYVVHGNLELNTSTLIFTADNWNTPQTVTLTSPPDNDDRLLDHWIVLVHVTESDDSAFERLWQIVRVVKAHGD